MIRQQGCHQGKQIVFGWDRHLVDEVAAYSAELAVFGDVRSIASPDDPPHYLEAAEWVSRCVAGSPGRVGVLVCSTGIGVSIAANKFSGIYAARCLTVEDAELARIVNNANVLCLAGRGTLEVNRHILASFMRVPYEGRRLEQLSRIATLERETRSPLHLVGDVAPLRRRRVG